MSEDALGRIERDLAVVHRAIGLHLSFGKGILVFDILLAIAATGAAFVGLQLETDWLQQVTFATVILFVLVGLFVRSRRTNHEINMQVLMSVTVYAGVWIAACAHDRNHRRAYHGNRTIRPPSFRQRQHSHCFHFELGSRSPA